MCKLFIDIETTGLPILKKYNNYHNPNNLKYYENSRIIEIGYQIYDNDRTLLLENDQLIKVNKTINNSDIHGITNNDLDNNGIEFNVFCDDFKKHIVKCDTIIAHNIKFDYNIILSELYRINNIELITKLESMLKQCTMILGKQALNIKKNPKLSNLYFELFNKKVVQSHRALDDTKLCSKCYYNMITSSL